MEPSGPPTHVVRLILIYIEDPNLPIPVAADGAPLPNPHPCPLRKFTRYGNGMKADVWTDFVNAQRVRFDEILVMEILPLMQDQVGTCAPSVVARLTDGIYRVILTPQQVEDCRGLLKGFIVQLSRRLAELQLDLLITDTLPDEPFNVDTLPPATPHL